MSIIAVSGKIGSGKSLVTKIIRYIDYKENYCTGKTFYSEKDFKDTIFNAASLSDWEEVKFAGKLKDIVCLLVGCTRAQLEDPVFKNTPLGEMWNFTYYNIVDQEENVLERHYSRKSANEFLPYWEDNVHNYPPKVVEVKQILTPRLMMQLIGTECMRNLIHPNIWVNSLLSDYKPKESKWIISDLRFTNEISSLLDYKPLIVRMESEIIRYADKDNFVDRLTGFDHESETGLDSYHFENIINNTSSTTISDLIIIVHELMVKNNLL
jgi:hypothetical protein